MRFTSNGGKSDGDFGRGGEGGLLKENREIRAGKTFEYKSSVAGTPIWPLGETYVLFIRYILR